MAPLKGAGDFEKGFCKMGNYGGNVLLSKTQLKKQIPIIEKILNK